MHRHSMGVVLKIVILGVKGVMRLVVFARNVRMMLREIRQMNVIVFLWGIVLLKEGIVA